MASEGPRSPGASANDASIGSTAWTNIGSIFLEDGNTAAAIASSTAASNYLKATTFGFSIPSGATIDGIVVEIKKQSVSSLWTKDNAVRIIKGGTIGSTDKSLVGDWPSSLTWATHGSSSDLWGESWSHSDINATDFGVAISGIENNGSNFIYGQIDLIRITVYYTAGGGSSGAAMHYYRQCQRHEQPRLILPDRELITKLPRFNRIENRLAT